MNGIQVIRGALRVAAMVSATAMASSALAQGSAYPNRAITLVLPFAAGSGTDTTTRLIGKELGTALGANIVIDNKAGANGSIAASYVARAPADGYTLFVTTKYRSKLLPDLPTMDEAGVKGFDITSWQGYLGPAGMPKDIVLKLNTELRKIIDNPQIKKDLADRGMEAFSGPPEEFDAFLKDQLVVWEKLIREAGIEKQ